MVHSRRVLTDALYRGKKISFVRHVVQHSPSFVCSSKDIGCGGERWVYCYAQVIDLSAFRHQSSVYLPSLRIGRSDDGWWFLLAFNRRSHRQDQLSAWWIDELSLCCWLHEPMSFTSSTENKWLQVSSSSRSFLKIRNRRGPRTKPWGTPLFTIPSHDRWPPNYTRKALFFRARRRGFSIFSAVPKQQPTVLRINWPRWNSICAVKNKNAFLNNFLCTLSSCG